MNESLQLCSPAKLNLFLHINRRRGPNETFAGYHELQTLFQILDYGDTINFKVIHDGEINISPPIPDIPIEQNLIYKAANALKVAAIKYGNYPDRRSGNESIKSLGAEIRIEKVLPMGGGIGGGSSNAATTLLALNKLWNLNFDLDILMDIAATIGADVPVFVNGLTAHAEGIGEQLQAIKLPERWYVVLHPDCHVSTAKIFSHERLTRDTAKKRIAPALEGQDSLSLNESKFQEVISNGSNEFRNDFEKLVKELYPEINDCLTWLSQYGDARMTGTGACCFCPVLDEQTAQKVLNEARSKFKGFIAKGVQLSPAIQRLNEA